MDQIDNYVIQIQSERMKNTTFVAPADRLLTADQIAAKLARLAPTVTRRL